MQVFIAWQLSDEEILSMFERSADKARAVFQVYEGIPQHMDAYADYTDSPREFYCWMLTLEAGHKSAQANLAWLEDVIQKIKNGEIPSS
ncbi:MAG: hypothetical protein P1S60_04230 [Anaerolineae bacterium]|nr:hypothetical protein [Anaerolineae bacterium]